MNKRIYRSEENKVVAGVCGGLGDYFDVDPTMVRLVAVVLFLATHGFAVLAYIVGWIIVPKRPFDLEVTEPPVERPHSSWSRYWPGLVLIGIGAFLLMREHWYGFDFDEWWPALLIIGGLLLLFNRHKAKHEATVNESIRQQSDLSNGGSAS